MLGLKVKARASAYFTKLGGDEGVFGWGSWGVLEGGNVLEGGGEERLNHYIIYLIHQVH